MNEGKRGGRRAGVEVVEGGDEHSSGAFDQLIRADRAATPMADPPGPARVERATSERAESAPGEGTVPDFGKPDQELEGIVIGTLLGFDGASGRPLVHYSAGERPHTRLARTTVELAHAAAGRQVAVVFENGKQDRPIVLGLIATAPDPGSARQAEGANRGDPLTLSINGETIELTATKEIVLRCGKSSITLTRAGKILIRGEYLLSRSSGVNRIKGGSVQIN